MSDFRRADAIVAARLRAAAGREALPGKAAGTTAAEIAAAVSAGSAHAERFRTEIDQAVHGMALALAAARPHPSDLWRAAAAAHRDPTVWFEQAVATGHPAHPLARSRGGLTDVQIRAWAPEHAPRFPLPAYTGLGVESSPGFMSACGKGSGLLPVHPWQAERHRLGEPQAVWEDAAPLMSLRTVSLGDVHVKCAVDLQLTSAVRHVSPAATANGPILSHHLAAPARRCGITLMPERSATARGPDGQPLGYLSAIARPAPHMLGHGRAVPLAALAEPCPATGRPIAAALAGAGLDRWWATLAEVLMAPLRLFADTGVALEAHGQNLLVAFDGDRPASLVYRDFGGVRLPPGFAPGLAGDLPCADPGERRRKLIAALFPTTLTALVEAVSTWTGTDPGQWWRPIADAARDACGDGPLATAVLKDDWTIKATTAMRLADRPTDDIWVPVANPLAGA